MSDIQWFVIIAGQKKGPFSVFGLSGLKGLTPDTLAWREGMAKWLPIREIPELQFLFPDNERKAPIEGVVNPETPTQDLVMSLPNVEPPLLFWFLFILIVFGYALFQFYFSP